MPPTLADRVRHIVEAIEDIERALASKSFEAFTRDLLLRLAIERLLEIVCEASRRVPDDVKKNYLELAQSVGYKIDDLIWVEHDK